MKPNRQSFTLIEMMVVIAIISILAGLLIPVLARAKNVAKAVSCKNNVKQLTTANLVYESQWDVYVAWGCDKASANLHRWHGTRKNASNTANYDYTQSPLGEAKIGPHFSCPILSATVDINHASVERGGFGYGYNIFVGSKQYIVADPNSDEAYRSGVRATDISAPSSTVMFSDSAMNVTSGGSISSSGASGVLAEYSTCVAPFGIRNKETDTALQNEPSMHFRHDGLANVGWCDGHADSQRNEWTLDTNWKHKDLGFIGAEDNNEFFDLE